MKNLEIELKIRPKIKGKTFFVIHDLSFEKYQEENLIFEFTR